MGLCGESGCVGVAALIDSKFVSVGVVVCGCDCVGESECVYVVLLVWLCRRKWSFMHVFHVCILFAAICCNHTHTPTQSHPITPTHPHNHTHRLLQTKHRSHTQIAANKMHMCLHFLQ